MRVRMLLLVVVGLAVGFAPAPFPRRDGLEPGKADWKKLQGEWVRTRSLVGGVAQLSSTVTTVTISGDRLTYILGGRPTYVYAMTLDVSKKPRALDIKGLSLGVEKTTFWGIYRLEGDTLTIWSRMGSTADARPTDFNETLPGLYFEVFQRRKR
jgi:uncharacterized protein (TIGR03067 family)